jgi:hypothetical protein
MKNTKLMFLMAGIAILLAACSQRRVLAQFAYADRVVLCAGDASPHVTVTGAKAREIVHIVTTAKPLPRPNGLPAVVGIKLLNEVRFYQGTNYLGSIHTSHGLVSAGGPDSYEVDKEKMESLIDEPFLKALEESQRQKR